jgi:hypothetical protein
VNPVPSTVSPTVSSTGAELLRRLDALEAESNDRREQLRLIADRLPAAISRRSMLRSLARDLRRAPNKGDIARRAIAKLGRAPGAVVKRLRRSRRVA